MLFCSMLRYDRHDLIQLTISTNLHLKSKQGPTDYIKLSIIGGKKLQFQYQAGSGPLGVNVETSYHLNDNQWHSVSVERNRYFHKIFLRNRTH